MAPKATLTVNQSFVRGKDRQVTPRQPSPPTLIIYRSVEYIEPVSSVRHELHCCVTLFVSIGQLPCQSHTIHRMSYSTHSKRPLCRLEQNAPNDPLHLRLSAPDFCSKWSRSTVTWRCTQWSTVTGQDGGWRWTRWNSTGCRRRICLRLLWPWPMIFWLQNLISTSVNPNTPVTKTGWNSIPSLVFQIWSFQGFLDAQTNTLTHGQTRLKTDCLRHRRFSMAKK